MKKKTATRKTAAPKKPAVQSKASKKKPATKKMSALDAAAKVLGESKQPRSAKEMIERMAAKKYWVSPGGLTPHATLSAAIQREIQTKGKDSRFRKADRGLFELNR